MLAVETERVHFALLRRSSGKVFKVVTKVSDISRVSNLIHMFFARRAKVNTRFARVA